MKTVERLARVVLPIVVGVTVLLGTMTAFCDDNGGVPSWERCRSWLGNSIIEWPGGNYSPLFALALGLAFGVGTWFLLRIAGSSFRMVAIVVAVIVAICWVPFVVSAFTV